MCLGLHDEASRHPLGTIHPSRSLVLSCGEATDQNVRFPSLADVPRAMSASTPADLAPAPQHSLARSRMPTLILSFLLAALLIELTPGPNMAYLALLSAIEGRRAALAATAGVAFGLLVIGAVAALGVAALLAASPLAFQVTRWLGVLYLLWLAWDTWRSDGDQAPHKAGPAASSARHFRRGFMTNILNPKAGLVFVAFIPGFVDPAQPVLPQTAVLTLAYVGIATAIHLLIVGLAGTARHWFEHPARRRTGRRIFAVLLAIVAVWFLANTT